MSGLIICLSSCTTLTQQNRKWEWPPAPKTDRVIFEPINDGYFLTKEDAKRLANNIDELKCYISQLEALVKEMEAFYSKK